MSPRPAWGLSGMGEEGTVETIRDLHRCPGRRRRGRLRAPRTPRLNALRATCSAGPDLVHLPGRLRRRVSAALAARAGARAVAPVRGRPSPRSTSALPDLGFVHGTDIARRGAVVRALAGLPLLADADTGYGNALQARHTARGVRRRRHRRPAPRGPGRAEALRPPRRQGRSSTLAEAAGRVRAAVEAGTRPRRRGAHRRARRSWVSTRSLERCRRLRRGRRRRGLRRGRRHSTCSTQVAAALAGRLPLVLNRSEAAGRSSAGSGPTPTLRGARRAARHPPGLRRCSPLPAPRRRSTPRSLRDGHAGRRRPDRLVRPDRPGRPARTPRPRAAATPHDDPA